AWIWPKAISAFWREILYFSVMGVPVIGLGQRAKNKRPGNLPGLDWVGVLRQCQYIRGQREAQTR
ncbi:hypothetical protein, partial [Agrobacterium tumefaciens]|uniref:hypothetical protein n=1 Tax=Agrobacterium tumefaciens TaxID=358 RepID=UPI001AEC97EC